MLAETQDDQKLLNSIDKIELDEGLFRLKDAMFKAPRKISVDRAKLAVESWKETEGEDIEIRRARLFQKIVEGVPIAIYDFDIIVAGKQSTWWSADLCG